MEKSHVILIYKEEITQGFSIFVNGGAKKCPCQNRISNKKGLVIIIS